MRASIAIGVLFFVYVGVAAVFKRAGSVPRLPDRRRHRPGLVGTILVLAGVVLSRLSPSPWVWHAENWLPGLYLLIGYWLPGQLPARAAPALGRWLRETDRRLFDAGARTLLLRAPRLILEYLELAYLSCYVIVPAGLAWLYLAGHASEANRFWTAVLAAALPCYALLPWFETRPPRSIEGGSAIDAPAPLLRRTNIRVLDRASVGANTFPSGHAAASLAAALAVGAVTPGAGIVFGLVAISIAIAAVAGRYHYALDVAFGMLAGVMGFLVSRAVS